MVDKIYLGRRKTSVARVILRIGSGNVKVNGSEFEKAFPQLISRDDILAPFKVTETLGTYDVIVNVKGGGFKGQSEAIRMAIARALVQLNEDFRKPLKERKFLTRDARVVERKKYGKPKARKSFQFSKR